MAVNSPSIYRSWSVDQSTFYGTDNFYEHSVNHLLRRTNGDEETTEQLEHQLGIDIERMGDTPITINGELPEAGIWTKDTFLLKVQSILGDSWETWKTVMYRPFCATVSQTVMAFGMQHFQEKLLIGQYILAGAGNDHRVDLSIDPKTVNFQWVLDLNIVHMDDIERSLVKNVFTLHAHFSPTRDTPYNGFITYRMDQGSLFDTMLARCDTIMREVVRRVEFPGYSLLGKPAKVQIPSRTMTEYFRRLADRIVSAVRLRETFAPSENARLYDDVRTTIQPYLQNETPIYDIKPDNDAYISYFALMKETIVFLNLPDAELIRFTKLAQNATSGRLGFYHIREILHQIKIYTLLRIGKLPVVRIRYSTHASFLSANERYRMEKNAERKGTTVPQPTIMSVEKTAETLPNAVSEVARSAGLLGGRYTKVHKRSNKKNRTRKACKIHTCRI